MIDACKLNIILDIDQTLLHAVPEEEDTMHTHVSSFENLHIYLRPGLRVFLHFLFKHFQVAVFTAGIKEYADYVVKTFFPQQPVFIYSRKHFYDSKQTFHPATHLTMGDKDLRIVFQNFEHHGFFPCNTFIIDDNPQVQLANRFSTIHIAPFLAGSQDSVLNRLIEWLGEYKAQYERNECKTVTVKTRCNALQSFALDADLFMDQTYHRHGRFTIS
jgi:RNA polymerase II subunit A small phosphatase-like protein